MDKPDADRSRIEAVIEDYFQGMYHSDVERLSRAFHPDGRITGYDEGKLINGPIAAFIQFIGGAAAPVDEGEAFDMEILAIDVAGDAATVKVRDVYKGLNFVDFLTLLKFEDGWRIVNKTFHHAPRDSA